MESTKKVYIVEARLYEPCMNTPRETRSAVCSSMESVMSAVERDMTLTEGSWKLVAKVGFRREFPYERQFRHVVVHVGRDYERVLAHVDYLVNEFNLDDLRLV